MIVRRLHTRGVAAIGRGKVQIPAEVILEKDGRAEGSPLRIDHLWIERMVGGERDGDYRVSVCEDGDGREGGGIFGDLLDHYFRRTNKGVGRDGKEVRGIYFPCTRYDKRRNADVYILSFLDLLAIWELYSGRDGIGTAKEISSAASIARERNMEKARSTRLSRKKHLKTHFK